MLNLIQGERAYVLNGRQNNFFPVTVTRVDEVGYEVLNEAKGERQWFYHDSQADAEADGDPEGPPRATLVPQDDWRIRILNQKKLFKLHQEAVIRATTDFGREPSTATATRLQAATASWVNFTKQADPIALKVRGIPEYLAAKKASN